MKFFNKFSYVYITKFSLAKQRQRRRVMTLLENMIYLHSHTDCWHNSTHHQLCFNNHFPRKSQFVGSRSVTFLPYMSEVKVWGQ